jgi:hypothetical protein
MRRAAVLLLAVAIVGGCARREVTLIPEGALPGEVYSPPEPTPTTSPVPKLGTIFLIEKGQLSRVRLQLQPVGSLPEALLFALLQQDPATTETAVPLGTRLNDLAVDGTVATVDLSGDFEQAAPPRSQALRIAQVVYTLTDDSTGITGVRFEIDGVPQEAIGGLTLTRIPRPVTRADYERFAPASGRESAED